MREDQIDQAERQAVLENDLKVLEQQRGSTFHQHAQSLADETNRGRFAAVGAPVVIGAKPSVASQYPAASSAHQTSLPAEKTGAAVAVAKRALPFFDWKRDARAA